MSCKYNNCEICGYKTGCEIYKENTDLEKACDETQELLDKQIEATYKLDKENAELKHESRAKENCWNCAYFKEKKYQACIDIKKNKTIRCAFYKWEGEK